LPPTRNNLWALDDALGPEAGAADREHVPEAVLFVLLDEGAAAADMAG